MGFEVKTGPKGVGGANLVRDPFDLSEGRRLSVLRPLIHGMRHFMPEDESPGIRGKFARCPGIDGDQVTLRRSRAASHGNKATGIGGNRESGMEAILRGKQVRNVLEFVEPDRSSEPRIGKRIQVTHRTAGLGVEMSDQQKEKCGAKNQHAKGESGREGGIG